MTGFFDQISKALGGDGGGFDLQNVIKAIPPEVLSQAASAALRQVPSQEYHDHAEPGVGGTDPIGSLGPQLIAAVAQALIGNLMNRGVSQSQIQSVPNVGTTNPASMSSLALSALMQWSQQNHPDALAQVVAQFQNDPNVIESLLGNQALQQMAIQMGGQFLREHTQGQ